MCSEVENMLKMWFLQCIHHWENIYNMEANLNTHTDSLSLQDCGVKTGKGSWCDGEKQSKYTEELL